VEDWGHTTSDYEDWTLYFRPVKCDTGKANATASNAFEATTVLKYVTKSEGETYTVRVWHPIHSKTGEVGCSTPLEKGINIVTPCVDGYSISAAPAKGITHVSF
jgi:hypothetical protein